MSSGLYKFLVNSALLIPHEDTTHIQGLSDDAYKVIKPERVPFISHPYEWSYSQLKHAALTTLDIQKIALDFGMSLKDCSAYNIQFREGKPLLIDTLSFEKYREGSPWIAYRQFCQHFFAPLALMRYKDIRLSQLLRVYLDGIPLDLSSTLLPFRTRFLLSHFIHIHLHAKSQKRFADKKVNVSSRKMERRSFLGLLDNLSSAIKKMKWSLPETEWLDYYKDTNYSEKSFKKKQEIVELFLKRIHPNIVWDLGANVGLFSRIASDKGIRTVSFDFDPAAVEMNYLECRRKSETNLLPLVIDLTNPSPSIGWNNQERQSLIERGPTDTVFALALIHHLAISNNLPFLKIAEFFYQTCNSLIIEFIPKEDSQVRKLLATREDIFQDYTRENFEQVFQNYFVILDSRQIEGTVRTLYMMKKIGVGE